ncbi:hypothetical protein GF338_02040 [candidate division WOR-3 bacterium]|nr:hypothetical protein [candidate division WOR-3 bacterium]
MKRLTLILLGLLITLSFASAQNISMVEDYSPSSPVEFTSSGETITIAEICFDVGADGGYAFVSAGGVLTLYFAGYVWLEVNGDSIPSTFFASKQAMSGLNTHYYSTSIMVVASENTTIKIKGRQTLNHEWINTYQSFRLQALIFGTSNGGLSEAPPTNPINTLPMLFCSSDSLPSTVQTVIDISGRTVNPAGGLSPGLYFAHREDGVEVTKITVIK